MPKLCNIPKYTVWKFKILLPLWLYAKWILANFRRLKTAISTILAALKFNFCGISHLKMSIFSKNLKFRTAKVVKMAFLRGFHMAKIDFTCFWILIWWILTILWQVKFQFFWFHVKSEWQKNLKFPHCAGITENFVLTRCWVERD